MTSALVWATGSRTSFAALVCALVVVRPAPAPERTGRPTGGGLRRRHPVRPGEVGQAGEFADRVGTDRFRAGSTRLPSQARPGTLVGQGLGEAWVKLSDGATYFFHNSYWALLIEGGWIYLLATLC